MNHPFCWKKIKRLTRDGQNRFFAVLNAIFLPILYFFYPETSGRSLEEIDLIFAKGYEEKKSYVHAAKEMPKLNEAEVAAMAREYGFSSSDDEGGHSKRRHSEREGDMTAVDNQNALMA